METDGDLEAKVDTIDEDLGVALAVTVMRGADIAAVVIEDDVAVAPLMKTGPGPKRRNKRLSSAT